RPHYRRLRLSKERFIMIVVYRCYTSVLVLYIICCITIGYFWITGTLTMPGGLLNLIHLPDPGYPIVPDGADGLTDKPSVTNIINFFTGYHIAICIQHILILVIKVLNGIFIF